MKLTSIVFVLLFSVVTLNAKTIEKGIPTKKMPVVAEFDLMTLITMQAADFENDVYPESKKHFDISDFQLDGDESQNEIYEKQDLHLESQDSRAVEYSND